MPKQNQITDRQYEAYLKLRDEIHRRVTANSENYDKSILTLSSAALGLSATFIKMLIPGGMVLEPILYLSWFFFFVAIVLTLLSFQISQIAMHIQLEHGGKLYLENDLSYLDKKNKCDEIVWVLGWVSGFCFVFAVFLVGVFACYNVRNSMSNEKGESAKIVRYGQPAVKMFMAPVGENEMSEKKSDQSRVENITEGQRVPPIDGRINAGQSVPTMHGLPEIVNQGPDSGGGDGGGSGGSGESGGESGSSDSR